MESASESEIAEERESIEDDIKQLQKTLQGDDNLSQGTYSQAIEQPTRTSSVPSISTISFVGEDSCSETENEVSKSFGTKTSTYVEEDSEDDSLYADTITTVDRASIPDSTFDPSMVGIDIQVESIELPCDPETCLALNRAYQEVLEEYQQTIEKFLAINLEKQRELEHRIQSKAHGKVNKSGRRRCWVHYATPYIRSKRGQHVPDNDDVRMKQANDEVSAYCPRRRIWTKFDKLKLRKAIIKDGRHRAIQPLMNKRNNEQEKLLKASPDEKELIQERIDNLKREIDLIVKKPDDECLPARDQLSKVDWMKISAIEFQKSTSADGLELAWKNMLDPTINNGSWTEEEDNQLRQIMVEYNYRNWEEIAEALQTNRTGLQCFQRFQTNLRDLSVSNQQWTPEEDRVLEEVVEMCTVGHKVLWPQVAYYIEGKNYMQCMVRWRKLNPNIKHEKWTPEEDKTLKDAIEKCGFEKNWVLVSSFMPGRSASQCMERYDNTIIEGIKRDRWSLTEDKRLLCLIQKFQGRWSLISNYIPGRTDHQCMKRYHVLSDWRKKDHVSKMKLMKDPAALIPQIQKQLTGRHSQEGGAAKGNNDDNPRPLVINTVRHGVTLLQEWVLKLATEMVQKIKVDDPSIFPVGSAAMKNSITNGQQKTNILNFLSNKMCTIRQRRQIINANVRPVMNNIYDNQQLAEFVTKNLNHPIKDGMVSLFIHNRNCTIKELLNYYVELQKLQSNAKSMKELQLDQSMSDYLCALSKIQRKGRRRIYLDQTLKDEDVELVEPMLANMLLKLMQVKMPNLNLDESSLSTYEMKSHSWLKSVKAAVDEEAESQPSSSTTSCSSSLDIIPLPPNLSTMLAFRCLLLERRKLQTDASKLDEENKSLARKKLRSLRQQQHKEGKKSQDPKQRMQTSSSKTVAELLSQKRQLCGQSVDEPPHKLLRGTVPKSASSGTPCTVQLNSLPNIPDLQNLLSKMQQGNAKGAKIIGTKSSSIIQQLSKCVGLDITQHNVSIKVVTPTPGSKKSNQTTAVNVQRKKKPVAVGLAASSQVSNATPAAPQMVSISEPGPVVQQPSEIIANMLSSRPENGDKTVYSRPPHLHSNSSQSALGSPVSGSLLKHALVPGNVEIVSSKNKASVARGGPTTVMSAAVIDATNDINKVIPTTVNDLNFSQLRSDDVTAGDLETDGRLSMGQQQMLPPNHTGDSGNLKQSDWDVMLDVKQTKEYQLLRARFFSLFMWPGFLSAISVPDPSDIPTERKQEVSEMNSGEAAVRNTPPENVNQPLRKFNKKIARKGKSKESVSETKQEKDDPPKKRRMRKPKSDVPLSQIRRSSRSLKVVSYGEHTDMDFESSNDKTEAETDIVHNSVAPVQQAPSTSLDTNVINTSADDNGTETMDAG